MSWVGGKKALREEVVKRFPLFYERYVEVFGGGGWVLFHKAPGNDFEVYNDFNGLLSNLYRCVRDKPDLLTNALKYVLNSREDFDRARLALRRRRTTSIQRAAWFYQIIRQSYAAALTSFASQPHDMWADFPLIKQAHRRLAKVVVENQDFEILIRHYDRPVTLFYLDPPYHSTEGYYQNIGEDGRVIVTGTEEPKNVTESPGKHEAADPLKDFNVGFRAMLRMAGVDLEGLRRQLRQEEMADE